MNSEVHGAGSREGRTNTTGLQVISGVLSMNSDLQRVGGDKGRSSAAGLHVTPEVLAINSELQGAGRDDGRTTTTGLPDISEVPPASSMDMFRFVVLRSVPPSSPRDLVDHETGGRPYSGGRDHEIGGRSNSAAPEVAAGQPAAAEVQPVAAKGAAVLQLGAGNAHAGFVAEAAPEGREISARSPAGTRAFLRAGWRARQWQEPHVVPGRNQCEDCRDTWPWGG